MGLKEIKEHKFFKEVNWNDMYEKMYDPPYVPTLTSKMDLKYFMSRNLEEQFENTTINMETLNGSMLNISNFTYNGTVS